MSELRLNEHEARALGVLIEKELTTPDQYPLSLNALVAGCNQKSNRNPVTDFTVAEVVVTMQGLVAKHLAGRSSGGRVEHFQHNAGTGLKVTREELAVLAELLLRGPQQPGELRTRIKRMVPVEALPDLMDVLQALADKNLVRNIGRSSGARAERWAQLLFAQQVESHSSGHGAVNPVASDATVASPQASASTNPMESRVLSLEQRVAKLEALLADLGG